MTAPHPGFVVWLTGLSCSGKSTLGRLVAAELDRRGYLVDSLDGDAVRRHLSAGLGFSREDRDTNVERVAWVASRLSRAGAAVVVTLISPYEAARRSARATVEEHAPFVEVHVATPLAVCISRDDRGLYAKAVAGEITNFTGVDDPYEEPAAPELRVDTDGESPEASARRIVARLEELGLVSEEAAA